MRSMKHILWPAVLLMATTTVGFAHEVKQGKYDRCHDKYEHREKCDRDHDKYGRDHDKCDRDKYDRDHDKCDRDHDRKEYPL